MTTPARSCRSWKVPLAAALMLLAAATTTATAADTKKHERHPGFVHGLEFVEMADPDGQLIEVNLHGKLLHLLSTRAVRKHDGNLATILGELVSVQAVIAEIDRSRLDEARSGVERIERRLLGDEWERFVRVREDKDEEYSAYVHMDDDEEIDGLVVIGFTDGDKVMFVNLAGRIDLERISLLGERLGVPGLDQLPTTDDLDDRRGSAR